jgi:hypothetical protein
MWRYKVHVKHDYQHTDDVGPYVGSAYYSSPSLQNFLAEVDRMNVVRRVQIHCVGIGEAQMGWLKPIAAHGRGQAVFFGQNKEDDPSLPDIPKLPQPSDD